MRQLQATRPRWLFLIAAAVHVLWVAAMPDPVTENDVQACEQGIEALKSQKTVCEAQIKTAQSAASERIASFKKYFSDVESQMKELEPGTADLKSKLAVKYAREAELYRDLHTESRVTSFLHRRAKLTSTCPSSCYSPQTVPGNAANGGAQLIDGKCTKFGSKWMGLFRFCGEGPAYEAGQSIRCQGCLESVLVDQWMQCDDNTKIAQQELDGCNVKAKTTAMWDTQREKQYKDKADVYIMRVARMAEPLKPQIEESARVDASISRMEQQVQDLKDNLPIA